MQEDNTTVLHPPPQAQEDNTTVLHPLPQAHGLWGRAGQVTAPSQLKIIFLLSLSWAGYSFSLLINGAAASFLRPRFILPSQAPGSDPLTTLGLVVLVLDPMFLLSTFRALASWVIVLYLTLNGEVPWSGGAAGYLPLNLSSAIPVAVGMTNALGYLFFLCLTNRGGVAIWSALVGIYIIFPVIYGIIAWGEVRTPRKLCGIAVCIFSSVLLGLGEEQKDEGLGNSVPWWSNALLFLCCIGSWGICDGLSAFMGRELHLWWVALLTGLGFSLFGLFCSFLGFFLVSGEQGSLSGPPKQGPSPSFGYSLMLLAQFSGVVAWFFSVKIGMLAEASAFIPILSRASQFFFSLPTDFCAARTPLPTHPPTRNSSTTHTHTH